MVLYEQKQKSYHHPPTNPNYFLTQILHDIYRGAINFEDTAHYRRCDCKHAAWISFLDLKLSWCSKTNDILTQLFVKPIVRELGIGIDTDRAPPRPVDMALARHGH